MSLDEIKLQVWIAGGNVNNLFSKISEGFSSHQINITEVR